MRSRRGRLGESRSVPRRRRHGPRSPAKYFVRCSKELLERLILVPWGFYVDNIQSDLRRNSAVKIYPRTGQPCQGRETADNPRSWQTGSFIPGSPCMRVSRSTIHKYDPAFHIIQNTEICTTVVKVHLAARRHWLKGSYYCNTRVTWDTTRVSPWEAFTRGV